MQTGVSDIHCLLKPWTKIQLTLQTNEAVVVLPTPGGPDSKAALKVVPSSLLPNLLCFAAWENMKENFIQPSFSMQRNRQVYS